MAAATVSSGTAGRANHEGLAAVVLVTGRDGGAVVVRLSQSGKHHVLPFAGGPLVERWTAAAALSGTAVAALLDVGYVAVVRVDCLGQMQMVQRLEPVVGHKAKCLVALPGGRLVVGCESGALLVYDCTTFELLQRATEFGEGVTVLLTLPGGRLLSGHERGFCRLWTFESADGEREDLEHRTTEQVQGLAPITSLTLASPQRVWVGSGDVNEVVSVLEVEGGTGMGFHTFAPPAYLQLAGRRVGCRVDLPSPQGASWTCTHTGFLGLWALGDSTGKVHVVWPGQRAPAASIVSPLDTIGEVMVLPVLAAPRCMKVHQHWNATANIPGRFRDHFALQEGPTVLVDPLCAPAASELKAGKIMRTLKSDTQVTLSISDAIGLERWRNPGPGLVMDLDRAVDSGLPLSPWVGFRPPPIILKHRFTVFRVQSAGGQQEELQLPLTTPPFDTFQDVYTFTRQVLEATRQPAGGTLFLDALCSKEHALQESTLQGLCEGLARDVSLYVLSAPKRSVAPLPKQTRKPRVKTGRPPVQAVKASPPREPVRGKTTSGTASHPREEAGDSSPAPAVAPPSALEQSKNPAFPTLAKDSEVRRFAESGDTAARYALALLPGLLLGAAAALAGVAGSGGK